MNKSDPSQNDSTAKVIALLPREDDPIRQISSGDHPHVTLFYLGDGETDMEALKELVKNTANLGYTFPDPFDMIAGEGTLGVEGAHVYFLDARFSEKVRSQMEVDPWFQSEMNKAEQFPTWTPHTTIGYPDAPAEKVSERPDGIVYDRLAIFNQGEVIEYPFDFTDSDDQPETQEEAVVASAEIDDEELSAAVEELQQNDDDWEVPVKGVLAPEGVPSSDGRMFSKEALLARDLPVPLRWVEMDTGRHDNAVIVGRIDQIFRDGDVVKFQGVFDTSASAYEAVRLIANGMLRGISVDVSDMVMAEGDDEGITEFSSAKIAAATLVAIPAFSEAFVRLGTWDDDEDSEEKEEGQFAVSEKSWDGSASRFTEEEYHRSCLIHEHPDGEPSKSACKLPIREPNGDINKNGVHAAASRINQVDASEEEKSKAKSQLKSAYKEIGEEPPEGFADDEFADKLLPKHKDAPGWITHPKPTKRITSYWVDGRGAAKIRWGQGGDFNRCRKQLAKYVKNPDWLAGLCANLHHRALGVWPGQHSLESSIIASASPSVTFVSPSGKVSAWNAETATKSSIDEEAKLGNSVGDASTNGSVTESHYPTYSASSAEQSLNLEGGSAQRFDAVSAKQSETQSFSGNQGSPGTSNATATEKQRRSGKTLSEGESSPTQLDGDRSSSTKNSEPNISKNYTTSRTADAESASEKSSGQQEGAPTTVPTSTTATTPLSSEGGSARLATEGLEHFSTARNSSSQPFSGLKSEEKGLNSPKSKSKNGRAPLEEIPDPRALPADWFREPGLEGPTPLTVSEEGRIWGHLASWQVCHIGFTEECVIAPRSVTNYSYFRTGEVDTTEGPMAVGQIVMGGPHANPKAKMRAAFVHYASTSSALADVNVGEDEHGIWIAGALRDGVSPEDLRALKASGLSGDWRHVRANGQANLELVAALAVNVQGFPIQRPSLAASGETKMALVAAAPVFDSHKVENRSRISEARSTLRAHRAARLKSELGF